LRPGIANEGITAISRHSIDYCQRIMDTYLPRRTGVALGGIEVWERARVAGMAYVDFGKNNWKNTKTIS